MDFKIKTPKILLVSKTFFLFFLKAVKVNELDGLYQEKDSKLFNVLTVF